VNSVECAVGLIAGGALQVTVVTVTVGVSLRKQKLVKPAARDCVCLIVIDVNEHVYSPKKAE